MVCNGDDPNGLVKGDIKQKKTGAELRPYVNGERNMGIRFPEIGELILVCLPFDIPGPASVISSSATSGSNSYNYHPCVVVSMFLGDDDWEIEVYICRSFSREPDAVSYVRSLPLADRNQLLPLPYHPRPYTPSGFGAPLSFSNYISQKPGWLIANPVFINMGGNAPYKQFQPQALLPASERTRIKTWLAVVSVTSATVLPPSVGGAGDGATGDVGDGATGGAGDGTTGGAGDGATDGGIEGTANGPGPVHGTTKRGLASKCRAAIVFESPQDDDSEGDDTYSEVHFSLEDFQLAAAPNSLHCATQVARREAERKNMIQQWIMNL